MSRYAIYNTNSRKVASVIFDASDDLAQKAQILSVSGSQIGYTERMFGNMVKVFNNSGVEVGFGKSSMPSSTSNIQGLISNFYITGRNHLVGGVVEYEYIKEAKDLLDIAPSITKGRVVKEDTSDLEYFIRSQPKWRSAARGDEKYIQFEIDTAIHSQLIIGGSSSWVLGLV
ncbi:MAG: hypothetical protein U0X74_14985 [Anaerolineales bacterium]